MITAISLVNFKAFEKVTIPLGALTLLSGVNGSGKSTLLQSLAVLRQSADSGCLFNGEGLLLNGELIELGTGRDVLFEYAEAQEVGIEVEDANGALGWSFNYSEKDDLLEIASHSSTADASEFSLFSRSIQFLRADRISPAVVFPKSYSDAVRRRFLGVRGQYAVHFLAHYQDEPVSERRRRNGVVAGIGLLEQVSAWLAEISPGVVVGSKELSGADLAQLWFTFGGRAGLASSNEYRPTNVGFGLTYSLPIVVACLSAARGDLILIENPEAHLHPRGQAIMGELLAATASDGVQVVFESHSEHVLNAVRLSVKRQTIAASDVAIHYCEVAADGRGSTFVTPVVQSDGRLSGWPRGFFDEWERALMELI